MKKRQAIKIIDAEWREAYPRRSPWSNRTRQRAGRTVLRRGWRYRDSDFTVEYRLKIAWLVCGIAERKLFGRAAVDR